jgi:deoxyribodipyrimidine photo-lyase
MTPAPAATRQLPAPDPGRAGAEHWVAEHLAGLFAEDEVVGSDRFRGGQAAADRALAAFDVTGYAATRNEAYPEPRRGASGLSPYIRHGLLPLGRVWDAVEGGPARDVRRFRDELLWQEYARHWYARLGPATARPLRHLYAGGSAGTEPPWDATGEEPMACLELTLGELEDDGWLVNQTRMWLASHWTVRHRRDWRVGEDLFFRHLLDGSRAANRLGWQWTTGLGSERAYGFSRWQVERRAPGLCADCELGSACPIDRWPDEPELVDLDPDHRLAADPDPDQTAGPAEVTRSGSRRGPEAVWLTAESLGHGDPALTARPDLPAAFVFDRPLLARLRLSAKRLVFLAETLAELAFAPAPDRRRSLEIHLGDPVEVLADRPVAATFAPVPGWARRAAGLDVVEIHPWPWLRRPNGGPVSSHRAWSRSFDAT